MSLFGGLFEDEAEQDEGNAGSAVRFDRDNIPPPPRLSSGLCGIYNQGATCYLNSLLQTLLMTPEFRETLFQIRSHELGRLEDRNKLGSKVRVIPLQLERLFARILLSNQQGASTAELTDSFGWSNNEEMQQHDVQELNRILFCAIEDSLVGTEGHSLIHSLYHGNLVNQIICQSCQRVSEREEDFLDLSLAVRGYASLEQVLTDCYVNMELLNGNNQYHCDNCAKLVNAEKGARIRHLPPILTFSLLRFSYDFVKMERYKETGKFTFPTTLDMGAYCENPSCEGDTVYELFSVVIHRGSTHGGHYHAYIRDVDGLGKWTHPMEEEIQLPTDPATGKVDFIEFDSPIELLQAVLLQHGKSGLTVDALCAELMKQTGVSWNKRFKKQYGPINKFLKKYTDKFDYNPQTHWVSVKSYCKPLTSDPALGTPVQNGQATSDSALSKPVQNGGARSDSTGNTPVQNGRGTSDSTLGTPVQSGPLTSDLALGTPVQNGSSQKLDKTFKRPVTPVPAPGYAWFDFDDSRVRPVSESYIEKHFSGKECAYMLFYRKRSMARPDEAYGNPLYQVPPQFVDEVLEENLQLERQRENYELKINKVEIEAHFGCCYDYNLGALRPVPDTCAFMSVSLDRRKTVSELLALIRKVGGELVPDNAVIHMAKELPSGLHLYTCITDDDSVAVMHTPIAEKSKVFVWDGQQVNGKNFAIGIEFEPVLLTITYGNPSKFSHGFPKNLYLGELRQLISASTNIVLENLGISRVITKGADCTLVNMTRWDEGKTLQQLKVVDGDHFIAEDIQKTGMQLAQSAMARQSKLMSLVVENRCQDSEESWPVFVVEVNRDSTVGELKIVMISQMQVEGVQEGGRLRIDDDHSGVGVPLHEDQTLQDVGLQQGMRVVIEPGASPSSNQITLRITHDKAATKWTDLELIVDRTLTVAGLLGLVIQKAQLEGESWHLRRTNWCGEAGQVLDEVHQTLKTVKVEDGHQLLLREGHLPPYGFLQLPVWLLGSQQIAEPPGGGDGSMLSWLASSIQGLLGSAGTATSQDTAALNDPVALGDVVISKQATLEDLKSQIMTLPRIADLSVPTVGFLRLRVLEARVPTLVLRGLQTSLQRLKLTATSELGLQILQQEEDLNPNQVLLQIRQRIVDSRAYLPGQELVWDLCRGGATPSGLRQAIADFLLLPAEVIVIAKYFPDKFEWHMIKDATKQGRSNKGKKKGAMKVNLRQPPYNIKDGDVIGVKTLQFDPDDQDDFTTAEDDLGRVALLQEAEERRQRREENRKRNEALNIGPGGDSTRRRREMGIKIHVGDFR